MKKTIQMISLIFMCVALSLNFFAQTIVAYALILPDVPLTPDIQIILPPNIDWDELYGTEYPLKVYDYLKLQNTKDYTEYKGWTYLDFLSMKLYRNDGRPIYDDEGYLSFSDLVNYESYIDITTKLMQYNNDGFFATTLNSKLKSTILSAPFLELKYINEESRETSFSYQATSAIHDLNQNVGSGNYVNNGINPGVETYKFTDIDLENIEEPFMLAQMYFQGRAYWENAWWGGTGDEIDLYESISTLFKVAKRDWSNELIIQDDLIESEYLNAPIYYYHMPFIATASNLDNYIKINDEAVTPINELSKTEKYHPDKNKSRLMSNITNKIVYQLGDMIEAKIISSDAINGTILATTDLTKKCENEEENVAG